MAKSDTKTAKKPTTAKKKAGKATTPKQKLSDDDLKVVAGGRRPNRPVTTEDPSTGACHASCW
jgi:hypothetical protein